jgi:hypothetical protein
MVMSYLGISFIVEGQQAEELSREIQVELKDILGQEPSVSKRQLDTPSDGAKSPELIIASTALILSIPGVILAIDNLANRLATKKKVDQVLETVKKKIVNRKEATVRIKFPDGAEKEVSSVETVEVLEEIEKGT